MKDTKDGGIRLREAGNQKEIVCYEEWVKGYIFIRNYVVKGEEFFIWPDLVLNTIN